MALPDNGHYVHDDGYRSDRGAATTPDVLDELAVSLREHAGVHRAAPSHDAVEVEHDGTQQALTAIERTVREWDCSITDERNGWCLIQVA